MKYILKSQTIAGTKNINDGKENQDNITTYEDDKVLLVAVSDGCTNCNYPSYASRINGTVAVKIAKNQLIWKMQEKKFKQLLCTEYDKAFSDSELPYKQLCATTAFVIINKRINVYIAFSVGDTSILSYNSELDVSVFFEPINAFRKSATFFTNDNITMKWYGQFSRGYIEKNITGFILYSDGAESMVLPPYNIVKQFVSSIYISNEVYKKEENKLFSFLKATTHDDISVAILAVVDSEISENAMKYYHNDKQ